MKKYFNLFAFVLVALFCATSCSSDDDPTPAPVKKVVKEYTESWHSADSFVIDTKCSFGYENGAFSFMNIEEHADEIQEEFSLFKRDDKIVDEEGNVVCQDMKYNADGLLTYCNSMYGKFTFTYSNHRIATCVYVEYDDYDEKTIKEVSNLTWEGGKLVSIETTRTLDDELQWVKRTRYTYSSVPDTQKQMPRCLVPFLSNLYTAVPGITALGLMGDGAYYAVIGYAVSQDGKADEVHTVQLTFDADGYLATEKDASNDGSYNIMTYKY